MTDHPEILDLPVLPLRDVVVFPHMVIPLFVGRDKSIRALDIAMEADKRILLVAQKSAETDDPAAADLHEIGTLAHVLQLLKLPDGTIKVLVEGVSRARVDNVREDDGALSGRGVVVESEDSREAREVEAVARSLMSLFEQYVKTNRKLPPELLQTLSGIEEPGRLADTIAAHLGVRMADKQRLLETLDIGARLELLVGFVDGEIDVQQLEKRIRGRVKSQMEKSQREYYLNEQMKAIQKELGETDEAPNDVDELTRKIAEAGMPKPVEAKAKAELNKLKQMSPMSAEAAVVRNYLDWLLGVPWKKRTKVRKDLKAAQDVLDADHYGLEKVKERILEYLAVQTRVKNMKGAILCLVGPPGVGKTSLGQSIAKATNRKFVRMSLGGVRDEAEIRGHRRTYVGSMPGRIVQNLNKTGAKNPLFMLDEIDKMSMDFRGDPSSALLEVLDPGTEQFVQRPLPRSRPRPVRGDVRRHLQLAQHSRPPVGPHGSHPHPRLHRGREDQHRAALPGAQADEGERLEGERIEDRRQCDPGHRALLHARIRRAQPRARNRQDLAQGGQGNRVGRTRRRRPARSSTSPPRTSTSTWVCSVSISVAPRQRTKLAWSRAWPGPRSAASCCRWSRRWCQARAS